MSGTAVVTEKPSAPVADNRSGRLKGILLRFSLVSALVKVIGFSRSAAIAALVGAGAHLDAYFATQVIMGIVVITFADQYEMVVGQRVRQAADAGGDARVRVVGSKLFGLALVLSVICSLLYLGLYPLLDGWLANPDAVVQPGEKTKLALVFLPFVALYLPYRTISALLKGAGRYNTSFWLDATQAIAYFLLTVAFLAITRDSTQSAVIAVSAAQVASQALLLLVALWSVRSLLSVSEIRHAQMDDFREFAHEAGALYLFGICFFGFTIIDRHFAAVALVGGLSLLSFASTISNTIRSVLSFEQVFGIEFGSSENRQDILTRAIRASLRVGVPAAVLQVAFASELMKVAFQRGRFSADDAALSANVLVIYGLATILFLLWPIILRMLQALGALRSAFMLLPFALAATGVTGLLIVPRVGLPGAVIATGVGHVILVGGGIWLLHTRQLRALEPSDVALTILRIVALSGAATGIRYLVMAPDFLMIRLGVSMLLVLALDALMVYLFNTRRSWSRMSPTTP
ncbi:MAG: lipid II flippase MurJ [Gemmatimonas sp.]